MWDGPGPGRGGPPFRGDHRGEMFAGRDGPMPDFRGRDGMNMGPRPLDLPPMDMRRGDGPPMRGRDMEQRDMRGREQNRDFFGPDGERDRDFSLRRQYEMSIRDKLMTAPGFMGPGRNLADMEERGMPQRESMSRLMDMRDREMFRYDMPGGNNPNMDGRRGFPSEPMGRNDGFRDMRDRSPMGRDDIDGCDMDMPSRERGMMDFDRRGGPPFNARGGFDSDMDFRNRPGPEFRGRDRSPVRFGNDDRAPMERGRSGMPPDVGGPNRPDFRGGEGAHRDREFLHSTDSPPIDHYRSGEEMTLAEEWKSRRKEKPPITDLFKGMIEPSVPPGFGRESILGAPPPFSDRGRQPAEFPGKDAGFPLDQFAARDLPPVGLKAPLDLPIPFPEMGHPGLLGRAPDSKLWLGEGDPKQIQNTPNRDRRPSRFDNPDKNEKIQGPPSEGFKGLKAIVHDQRPDRAKMGAEPEFQSGSAAEGRDQDYRDIDYRTGSVRAFDYKHESFQSPEKVLKESKPFPPPKFSDSGSKDQDYRSASVEDQVSNTISIIGIPKTATMEQILGAFAVRDGVPMQGMKIKSVVPGYSYDTAYVEFLNLDDAVHFMESNKGSLKVGAKTASMKYVQPDKSERDLHESLPQVPEALLPGPGELLDSSQNNVNGSSQQAKDLLEPLLDPLAQWQRNCDLTPEAWQQQVDQQLKQQEAELQAESWAGRANPPRHGPPPTHGDPIFKESKTMILKNVKPTTTVETILKALDPFAYLDERNVRLVKGKTPGAKCFCFVDMDSHEQVVRLVELLTKPRPLNVDGVRVYAEVAKPLKNQNIKRESDKPFTSLLGYPPDANMMEPPPIPDLSLQYSQHLQQQALHPPPGMQGDPMAGSMNAPLLPGPNYTQGVVYGESPAVDQPYHQPPPVDQSYHQPPPVDQLYHQPPAVDQLYHQPPAVDQSYHQPPTVDQSYHQAVAPTMSGEAAAAGMTSTGQGTDGYIYGSETPDMSGYLYDGTSGFFYDPQTTLYYDPNSRYFYNSQTQEYLYWDGMTKTYIPVPSGGSTAETTATQQPLALSAEVQAILANPAADAPLEMKKPAEPTPVLPAPTALPPLIVPAVVAPEVQPPAPEVAPAAAAASAAAPAAASTAAPPAAAAAAASTAAAVAVPITPTPTPPEPAPASALTPERREDDDSKKDNKEEKPRSLAAVKIMKDMERWAKIQNRQKDAVRSPSPVVLKPGQDDKRTPSKAADAGFAIFAKAGAGDDLFKKPLAPPSSKKDEKGKRHMGSLGLLASDYGAGSDEEVEEEKHDAPKPSKSNKKSDDKDDKLTDWKKMACLLCRRQFPNKDALIRHQQLSDLHKQNMEIHLKIKRSKKELEALENQEKELIAKDSIKSPPETKKRKHHHQQHQHNTWAGSSKDSFKGSERPGLGAEPAERKKKEPVVWDHATYKQAVRKAMFARFKELE